MALKFAMVVQLVDRLSGPGKRVSASQRAMEIRARRLGLAAGSTSIALDRMTGSASGLQNRMGVGLLSRIRQLSGPMGMLALEKGAYGAGRAIGWTIKQVGALALRVGQLAATSALIGSAALFGGVLATTAKFEQFQVMLEGTEGSAAKARKAMAWVQNFAKRTPYELEQVMEAFVQLKAYGIDPMDGSLRAAGDAASGMSKQLIDAVEAMADAQTGEFERLKSFGITARTEGNRVTFSYVKNNKEIRKEVAKTSTAMKDAITGIWNDRFGGGMDRQSGTLLGLISNLKDQWALFMLKVGQAGVFDRVKEKLEGLLNWLNKKLDDGSIDKWAKSISLEMEKVVKWVGKLDEQDLENFAGDLKTIATSIGDIVKGLGQVFGLVRKIDEAWAGVDSWVDKWGIGGSGWGAGMDALNKKAAQSQRRPGAPIPSDTLNRIWGTSPVEKMQPRAPATGVRSQSFNPAFLRPPAGPQKVSGKITLDVRTDPGTSVRTRKIQATGLDLAMAYRGAPMMGPA